MYCTNCFNGCPEVISDQCVKYTGVNYLPLNITKGDTLYSVEQSLIKAITDIQTGETIIPIYTTTFPCDFIAQFLPLGNINLNNVLQAYMSGICELNDSVTSINTIIGTLETNYDLNCIDDEIVLNNTHAVLQSTINKLCTVSADLTALQLEVQTNYVRVDSIDEYIEDYINNSGTASLMNNKMVPYVVYEYYGPLSYFDISGAGTGNWLKIYLCNGQNGTPDKRGVVAVGVTSGMQGGSLNPAVDPAFPGNPTYTLGVISGTNTVALTQAQMPSHTHTGSTSTTGAHTHTFRYPTRDQQVAKTGSGVGSISPNMDFTTESTSSAGDHSHTLTINPIGGGQAHPNVQPGVGCYYIQYRP